MSKPPEDEERTVYQPKDSPPAPALTPAPVPRTAALGEPPRQLPDGEVLNGIYRITRFIAKGGMGEVYEAVNIHQPTERVAVKVMLEHLAQDELVVAMFAKEAATLTRLHHEAIVPYRLAARDSLGRPYIVTEFIPGPSLEEKLGTLTLPDSEFLAMTQKLAAGLGAAHTLGAIHRDIAPDNILLLGGDPRHPKIIDFGIAKDAREQTETIIGDGFAGKLRYVAPEQLGEHGRSIGPWTDIYSLALTLRAVAAGKPSDMGGLIAEAVRKRMSVPDLSNLPEPFQPAFEAALQPIPAHRPQSMAEFIAMLGGRTMTSRIALGGNTDGRGDEDRTGPLPRAELPVVPTGAAALAKVRRQFRGFDKVATPPLLLGIGAVALIGLAALMIAWRSGDDPPLPSPATDTAATTAATAARRIEPGTPEFAALVEHASVAIPCSWLSLTNAGAGTARFTGAAAVPAEAQTRLAQALRAEQASVSTLDFGAVLTFPPAICPTLDALRAARGDAVRLSTPQMIYELRNEPIELSTGTLPAQPHAKVQVKITSTGALRHIALVELSTKSPPKIYPTPETMDLIRIFKGKITDNEVTFTIPNTNDGSLQTGVAVIWSDVPLPANITSYDDGWPQRFEEGARAKRWQADAVWIRLEDRQPG